MQRKLHFTIEIVTDALQESTHGFTGTKHHSPVC